MRVSAPHAHSAVLDGWPHECMAEDEEPGFSAQLILWAFISAVHVATDGADGWPYRRRERLRLIYYAASSSTRLAALSITIGASK